MNVYKQMYYRLFNRVSEIIRQLQAAQQETEEIFLNEDNREEAAKEKTHTEKGTD